MLEFGAAGKLLAPLRDLDCLQQPINLELIAEFGRTADLGDDDEEVEEVEEVELVLGGGEVGGREELVEGSLRESVSQKQEEQVVGGFADGARTQVQLPRHSAEHPHFLLQAALPLPSEIPTVHCEQSLLKQTQEPVRMFPQMLARNQSQTASELCAPQDVVVKWLHMYGEQPFEGLLVGFSEGEAADGDEGLREAGEGQGSGWGGSGVEDHIVVGGEGRLGEQLQIGQQPVVVLYFEEGVVVLISEAAVVDEDALQLTAVGCQFRRQTLHLLCLSGSMMVIQAV